MAFMKDILTRNIPIYLLDFRQAPIPHKEV